MAVTALQRDVCRLLAADRRARGESYVAGGVALGVALGIPRYSHDLDLFHDTDAAVASAWDHDRHLLEHAGYRVEASRERPGFVEATVSRDSRDLLVEWARDSAFRFFPLVEDELLGLALHPFDLATNKVLALVGRLEVRDWIDVIACDQRLQPLGYLAWAACGKDPGFTPTAILRHSRRSGRYTETEVSSLAFEGAPPSAAELSHQWHAALDAAEGVVAALPPEQVGAAVLTRDGELFREPASAVAAALEARALMFHVGRIGGAWPKVKE